MGQYIDFLTKECALIPENVYFTNWECCKMNPHTHPAGGIEFNYVTAGECEYYIADKCITLKKKNLLIINSAISHRLSFISEKPCLILGMDCGVYPMERGYVSLQAMMEIYPEVREFLLSFQDYVIIEDGHKFFDNLEEIWKEVRGEWNYAYIQAACNKLLIDMARWMKNNKSPGLEYVEKAKQYMAHHYFEIESIEEIAGEIGIHKVYLQRIFKRHTQETIGKYLLKIRLKMAASLLADSDIPIGEIDTRVGIHSRQAFYHNFKKYYGISPREYRKKYQTM